MGAEAAALIVCRIQCRCAVRQEDHDRLGSVPCLVQLFCRFAQTRGIVRPVKIVIYDRRCRQSRNRGIRVACPVYAHGRIRMGVIVIVAVKRHDAVSGIQRVILTDVGYQCVLCRYQFGNPGSGIRGAVLRLARHGGTHGAGCIHHKQDIHRYLAGIGRRLCGQRQIVGAVIAIGDILLFVRRHVSHLAADQLFRIVKRIRDHPAVLCLHLRRRIAGNRIFLDGIGNLVAVLVIGRQTGKRMLPVFACLQLIFRNNIVAVTCFELHLDIHAVRAEAQRVVFIQPFLLDRNLRHADLVGDFQAVFRIGNLVDLFQHPLFLELIAVFVKLD